MKYLYIASILLVLTLLTGSNPKEFNYLPASINNHQIVSYTQFTLSYNEQHEQADWVAYELTREEVAVKRKRCDCFRIDRNITTGSASASDYKYSGYDRGHISPAADNNMSEEANKESFLMSNMSPQLPDFNRKIWKTLESWTRERASIYGSVYIVTGPVFKDNIGTIGKNQVTIPGYYYKALLRSHTSTHYSIAFLIPQHYVYKEITSYILTIDSLETITGIDFFPTLEDVVENKVEAQSDIENWTL